MNDRVLGLVLCTAATVAFAYYTVWALVTPFIDDDHPVLDWFPDRRYAVLLPAALGALLGKCPQLKTLKLGTDFPMGTASPD